MSIGGILFFIFLILNTAIALAYLYWFLIFKKDEDNRKQYIMHTIIMILCPLVGVLYFLLGNLKYHFIKFGQRDLTDVEFGKRRQKLRVKADEERERNIVSVEESIVISDQEKKRTNMLNILLGETDQSLSAIALALDSDDSEVAHYAASFLQNKMDEFRENVRKMQRMISEGKPEDEECQKNILALIHYMNHILKQKVLTGIEQRDYVNQMEDLCKILLEHARSKLSADHYEEIFYRLIDLTEYEKAEFWAKKLKEQYPDHLKSYTLLMKLYFETVQKEKFFEVLEQLRKSTITIDNQTLEMIRMIQM